MSTKTLQDNPRRRAIATTNQRAEDQAAKDALESSESKDIRAEGKESKPLSGEPGKKPDADRP